jgi:hypothetical protein
VHGQSISNVMHVMICITSNTDLIDSVDLRHPCSLSRILTSKFLKSFGSTLFF